MNISSKLKKEISGSVNRRMVRNKLLSRKGVWGFECGRPTDVRPTDVHPIAVRPTDVRPTDVCLTDVRPTDVHLRYSSQALIFV